MSQTTVQIPQKEYQQLKEIARRFDMLKSLMEPEIFSQPPTKDIDQIITEFRQTGLYNEEFLQSLGRGLKESVYFSASN